MLRLWEQDSSLAYLIHNKKCGASRLVAVYRIVKPVSNAWLNPTDNPPTTESPVALMPQI